MQSKKRVYIGLLAGSLLFALGLIVSVWYILTNRDIIISQILLIIIVVLAGVVLAVLGLGIIAIVVMIVRSKTIPSLESITQLANEVLFPVTILVGRLVGISKDRIMRSYIEVNNYLVRSKQLRLKGEQIMILAPHCLQNSECPYKITITVDNCKQCGKCKIGALKELAEEHNAVLKVATGGTLARKFIKEVRPAGVVAIACERDLSQGIQDMSVIPVIGVLNCRPNGPCYNTDVDLEAVKQALETIKNKEVD